MTGMQQPEISCMEAHNLILQLRFAEAQSILEQQKEGKREKSSVRYLENLQDFIQVMIAEEEEGYAAYKTQFRKRIETIREDGDKDSPLYLFLQAEMHMHSFFIRFKFQDTWKAFVHFYTSYRLVQENISLFPDFQPNGKILGIQEVILGAVPEKYSWILKFTGMSGNVEKGIEQLKDYHQFTGQSTYPELEAIMILAHVYIQNSSQDDEALEFLQGIPDQPFGNPLFRFTYVLALNKAGKNQETITLLEKFPQGKNELPFLFLDFLLGEAKLNRLDNDANRLLESYLNGFHGMHYIKSAWHKLSWYHFLQGDLEKYNQCREMVLKAGKTLFDSDKQAFHEVMEYPEPNHLLLTARLLFDGGYYHKTGEILLQQHGREKMNTLPEKLEYAYRLARVYHKLGEVEKAERYYRLVIGTGAELPYYYASYSALQMGKILEIRGENERAASLFRTALELSDGPYGNSIAFKARAALQQLE
jgi:tetratricopeptide (TPR) repeat protein